MNSKRKKVYLIMFLIGFILIILYLNKERAPLVDDMKRDVDIVEFERNAQLDNPPNTDKYGHETGNGALVSLSNRLEFLDSVNNLDYGLSVVNALNEALDYINIISEYEGGNLGEYYDKNKEVINNLYGIKDIDTFTRFYNDLGNGKVIRCNIMLDTLVESNDIYKFDIELSGDKKVIIPVKVLAKDDDDMIGSLHLYN